VLPQGSPLWLGRGLKIVRCRPVLFTTREDPCGRVNALTPISVCKVFSPLKERFEMTWFLSPLQKGHTPSPLSRGEPHSPALFNFNLKHKSSPRQQVSFGQKRGKQWWPVRRKGIANFAEERAKSERSRARPAAPTGIQK